MSFVGKTSFAEGLWYGVALDEPNGKNCGSVQGVQYFKCEPSFGLFVRQHQIVSLSALSDAPPQNGILQIQLQKTPVPPRGVSQLQQPSRSTPTGDRPPSANSIATKLPYALADRIMVGGKKGIVRYIGRTQFAKGMWTGIELENPDGKNNGTIEGIKYFTCAPKHGLFAPVMKVTLIPNSLPNLQIQTQPANKRTPPSTNSLTSSGSARHTVIRERPSSRNSSSSINSAGRAKREDSDMELEGQISGLINKLEEVSSEKASLEDKLAEEKNVREDLQFSLDEHAVTLDLEGPRTPGILREKKQEVEILHGTIRKLEQGLAKAYAQFHTSSSEAEELRESLDRERKYTAQLEKEAALRGSATADAPATGEGERGELQRALRERELSLQEQSAARVALEETVCSLKKELSERSEQLEGLEREFREARNTFENERRESVTELNNAEGLKHSLKQELSGLREELNSAKEELGDRESNLATMSRHLSSKDSVIEDMRSQFDQVTEEFHLEREDLQAPLDELKSKTSRLEGELARVKRDLRESESLRSELAKYKVQCAELQESLRQSQQERGAERASVLVQEEECHRLQQELASAKRLLKQREEESSQQQLMLVELEESNRRKNSRLILMEQNYLQNGDVNEKLGNETLEDPLGSQNYRLDDDLSTLPFSTTPDESLADSPTNPWGQQTTRLYCDICEQFDLHDTEDCPIQNENDSTEDNFQTPKLVLAYSEREYCEVCEMFGHSSESCDTQETF